MGGEGQGGRDERRETEDFALALLKGVWMRFEGEHIQNSIGPERLCIKVGQSGVCKGDSGGM